MNYLFLTQTHHGSLINLRSPSVKRRFVSTTLTLEERQKFTVNKIGWRALTPEFEQLQILLIALLREWGAFLDFRLYREALTHLLGGADNVIKRIPVRSQGRVIGNQEVHMLTDDFAFAVSAIKTGRPGMLDHQRRFLNHTHLHGIAWINLKGHEIEFTTILSS